MRRVIGLTGGIASGKSTVSAYLKEKGIRIIDADKISRELSDMGRQGYQMIVQKFGEKFLNADGSLNRRELGKYVFAYPAELERLEAILHPLIILQIKVELEKAEGTVVIDAPLLHKAGLDKLCTEIWVVRASEEMQISRMLARDGISGKEALDRLKSQALPSDLELHTDVVLLNDGVPEDLYRQIDEVLNG